ncbi:hypothetical protein ACA910_019009 [Epithemia clementina (nom. ined.)]
MLEATTLTTVPVVRTMRRLPWRRRIGGILSSVSSSSQQQPRSLQPPPALPELSIDYREIFVSAKAFCAAVTSING